MLRVLAVSVILIIGAACERQSDMAECTPAQTLDLMRKDQLPIDYERLTTLYSNQEIAPAMFRQLNRWGCMPIGHSFLIGVRTNQSDVKLSQSLKLAHPDEIWLIFQHEFDIIEAGLNEMSVKLYFNGKPEIIRIPYDSVFRFIDEKGEIDITIG